MTAQPSQHQPIHLEVVVMKADHLFDQELEQII
jgi:hypothetical protein